MSPKKVRPPDGYTRPLRMYARIRGSKTARCPSHERSYGPGIRDHTDKDRSDNNPGVTPRAPNPDYL
jgi:hypothetical protein